MSSYDTWHNLLSGISQGSFDKIYVRDANGNMVDLLTLLAASGGSGGTVTSASLPLSIDNAGALSLDASGFATAATSPLNLQNGLLTIDLSQYSTTSQIAAILANYVTSTSLTTLLAGKISTSHPANNVGSAAVNFGAYPITTSALTLTNKDLTQGGSGELLWGGQELQLRANAFHSISVAAPLTVSGANSIVIDTHWKPSTVSVGSGLSALANDATGTLQLALTGTESRAQLSLIDSQGSVRNLVPSISGALTYDGTSLVGLTYVTNALGGKMDTFTAGANVTLSNNVLSAVGDVTLSHLNANFLSPLNPGTCGVTQGLSSVLSANSWIISVDENSDSRTLFTLRDSGNVARNITASTSGQLLFGGAALATETQLASSRIH